jgi:U4/U6.U5 tri-snRNP-associated protein 1
LDLFAGISPVGTGIRNLDGVDIDVQQTLTTMADAESITLEESNRIRIGLGLAPLKPVSDTTSTTDAEGNVVITADDEERQAVENLKALRAEQDKVAREKSSKQRLQRYSCSSESVNCRENDRKALNEKLEGKSLGAADGKEEDLKSWIKRTKKRERDLAAKEAHKSESQGRESHDIYREGEDLLCQAYEPEHLAGLTVGHDFDDIEEGERTILTIKDRGVLDDDDSGDELISTALAEKERLKENLDNKIRKPKYDPYAEEFDPETGEKKMLSKYDEDIDAPKKQKTFVLGQEPEVKVTSKRNVPQVSNNMTAISLDYDRPMQILSDYADPSTFKIKKPKKKKAKNITRVADILDDEGLIANGTDMVDDTTSIPLPSIKRTYDEDAGFGDDDELQEALAQRRRLALKKRKIMKPEDIAASIRQAKDDEDFIPQGGGLVIDDTSEFVRGLEIAQQEVAAARIEKQNAAAQEMDVDVEAADTGMLDNNEIPVEQLDEQVTTPGQDEEPLIAGSVAATLAALRRKGTILLCMVN